VQLFLPRDQRSVGFGRHSGSPEAVPEVLHSDTDLLRHHLQRRCLPVVRHRCHPHGSLRHDHRRSQWIARTLQDDPSSFAKRSETTERHQRAATVGGGTRRRRRPLFDLHHRQRISSDRECHMSHGQIQQRTGTD
jgi:hypothetical protein